MPAAQPTNALAGETVSTAGDRRPTTDRIVAYYHVDEFLPQSFPRVDLAVPERTHESARLRRLIILDFPDFDSVEADHAALVVATDRHLGDARDRVQLTVDLDQQVAALAAHDARGTLCVGRGERTGHGLAPRCSLVAKRQLEDVLHA